MGYEVRLEVEESYATDWVYHKAEREQDGKYESSNPVTSSISKTFKLPEQLMALKNYLTSVDRTQMPVEERNSRGFAMDPNLKFTVTKIELGSEKDRKEIERKYLDTLVDTLTVQSSPQT